jgi:hypothetical protein
MNFRQYLSESEKSYKYRIKAVVDLSDKDTFDRIETYLTRFKLVGITNPFKTILQKAPLDFPNFNNTEVFMIDFETSYPLSSYVAAEELRTLLNIPGGTIVVRGANEPIEIETKLLNQKEEVAEKAEKQDLAPAPLLGVDNQYPESEQGTDGQNYYGNSYNSRFLEKLKDVEDSRKVTKFDPPAPLFKWLDMPKKSDEPVQDAADFNADIETPKAEKEDKDAREVSAEGNFSTQDSTFKKDFINPRTGAAKTIAPKMPKAKKTS